MLGVDVDIVYAAAGASYLVYIFRGGFLYQVYAGIGFVVGEHDVSPLREAWLA